MYDFFDSYYYEDNKLIWIESITFESTITQYPNIYKIYKEISPELDQLNQLRKHFMKKYKYVISFHPFYTIYDNVTRPDISLHRRKEKFLDSRLSLSIASKSKAILISFNNTKKVYIPDLLKEKSISIEKLNDFNSSTEKLFNRNKPTKDELILILKELTTLNKKIDKLMENKIPFTLLANEDRWDRVFF